MRKVVLYIAASLDGYIARPDDTIDWLENKAYTIAGEDFGYSSFMETIDTTLMGHSTYQVVLGMGSPFPYANKTNYVFSRSSQPDAEHVQFINSNVAGFVKDLKQQPGKDIWLIGGSQINTILLNANLIEEIILTYIPIILGRGIPLFTAGASEKLLQVQESKTYDNGFVQVRLQVNNNQAT